MAFTLMHDVPYGLTLWLGSLLLLIVVVVYVVPWWRARKAPPSPPHAEGAGDPTE